MSLAPPIVLHKPGNARRCLLKPELLARPAPAILSAIPASQRPDVRRPINARISNDDQYCSPVLPNAVSSSLGDGSGAGSRPPDSAKLQVENPAEPGLYRTGKMAGVHGPWGGRYADNRAPIVSPKSTRVTKLGTGTLLWERTVSL